jgi:hypothetical protein
MPSNVIKINCSDELTWIVPDSQMKKLIAILDKCGDKHKPISSDTSSSTCLQTECQP